MIDFGPELVKKAAKSLSWILDGEKLCFIRKLYRWEAKNIFFRLFKVWLKLCGPSSRRSWKASPGLQYYMTLSIWNIWWWCCQKNMSLSHRLKPTLPDVCSLGKRAARECFFSSLRYSSFLTKRSAKKSEESSCQSQGVDVAWRNLLQNAPGATDIEMGWWSMCHATNQLRMDDEFVAVLMTWNRSLRSERSRLRTPRYMLSRVRSCDCCKVKFRATLCRRIKDLTTYFVTWCRGHSGWFYGVVARLDTRIATVAFCLLIRMPAVRITRSCTRVLSGHTCRRRCSTYR